MNRRSFFGRAVTGTAVVAAAPQVLANIPDVYLPKITFGNIRWHIIDGCGEACRLGEYMPYTDPAAGYHDDNPYVGYHYGNPYLREAIRVYLEDTGYPCRIVNGKEIDGESAWTDGDIPWSRVPWTRKLKVKYDPEYCEDIKAFSGQHIIEVRDYWRSVIQRASKELVDVWGTIAPTGTLFLYRALFTPRIYDPESFTPHHYILIRAVYLRK